MLSPRAPLWLAGFRPFFLLACASGALLPIIWALMFTGVLSAPPTGLSPTQWHAHEMFYGFGWALLGGFLLTSTKNWVNIRGYHGATLMALTAAWVAERVVVAFSGMLPSLLVIIGSNLYLVAIVALLLRTLLAHREKDSYRIDNLYFIVALPLFVVAKNLLLGPDTFAAGTAMTLALFRIAFLLMLERTLTQFMKGVFQVTILRQPGLDNAIKLLALLLACDPWLPATFDGAVELTLASLLLGRFLFWKPLVAMRRLDVFIMYLGYLGIVAQLLLDGTGRFVPMVWVGTLTIHVFTFGVMGLIIPAMIVRIANGHTGRKVVFDARDRLVLWIMLAALLVRIVAPQIVPNAYLGLIHAAAACWLAAFGLLAWRYVPYLMAVRIDGKEH